MRGNFAHTFDLIKFIVRRERVISVIWLVTLLLTFIMVPVALDTLMGEEADRLEMANMISMPAMTALLGPAYGLEEFTVGKMFAAEMLLLSIITVALMNIFFVIRHTRADEEKGRIEVVRSLPVGRLSNLAATLISAFALNLILAVFTGLGLAALGIESIDLGGSMVFGFALGAGGLLFAAIAAVFAQLSVSSSGAVNLTALVMAALYLIRAVGDTSMEILSVISPLGLILRVEAYHSDNWLPIIIVTAQAVVIAIIALALNRVRDMGQGFIPAKPGRKTASRFLRTPLGLTLRLTKNSIIGWLIGMFALGLTYGAIMGEGSLESFIEGNEYYQLLLGVDANADASFIIKQFIIMIMLITALIAVVPVLGIIMRAKKEEFAGRAEGIIAAPVSRRKYLAGYFGTAAASSAAMLVAGALGLYAACSAVMEEPPLLAEMLESVIVYLPAVLVMLGFTTLIIGILPGKTMIAWAYFGFSFFVTFLGPMMQLPKFTEKLTPFGYVGQNFEQTGLSNILLLTGIFLILSGLGFLHYRRRDLQNQ
jgi:ABC-2 type transport system permease protein